MSCRSLWVSLSGRRAVRSLITVWILLFILSGAGGDSLQGAPRPCSKIIAVVATSLLSACASNLSGTKSLSQIDGVNVATVTSHRAPNEPIFTSVRHLTPEEEARHLAVIEQELRKYPQGLLDDYVDNILMCRDCSMNGAGVYGFYNRLYPRDVMVVYSASKTITTTTLHHEIAHLLWNLNSDSNLKALWIEANGEHYRGSKWMIDHPVEMLHKHGFASHYARQDFDEDFAELAETLWTSPRELFEACLVHERLRKKTALLIGFYSRLDPRMDFDFFWSLQNPN